ncbi:hypothetical protein [Thermotoga sp. RQ2]|jgi:hypothetical protein|uniref:hypothetical protein n=1 Tax=Thermotoga sp. (strain RQ2) TaxID=126740 RepID=UPI0000552F9E|nr:hypothetical protein [Thermotoga sp. RQ2]AAZ04337.1 hypothetical protein [Thermotoga sp. RQ2]MBZ4661610.1 hypothetical protein [Thermotoga sp.]MDK2898747.1 hypothetical protein [Thermotoga sp.]
MNLSLIENVVALVLIGFVFAFFVLFLNQVVERSMRYYVEITKIFQIQEKLDEIFVKEELRDDGFEEVNSTLVLRKNGDSETLNITLYRSSEKNPVFVFMYAK